MPANTDAATASEEATNILRGGTVPYKIADAVLEACRRRRRRQRRSVVVLHTTPPKKCGGASDDGDEEEEEEEENINKNHRRPIDLLGIVEEVSTTENTFSHSATTTTNRMPSRHCHVWIADGSLPCHHHRNVGRCCVSFYGVRKTQHILHELKLRSGDVIRINRVVECQRNNSSADDVYRFCHDSFHDPEAGVELFRLGHLEAATGIFRNQVDAEFVPESMRTDPDCLRSLLAWYRSTNRLTDTGHPQQGSSLSPPPCQNRTLAELLTCHGVECHVVARVLRLERINEPNFPPHSHRSKKRRKHTAGAASLSTLATLTDDGGLTLLPLCLESSCNSRLFDVQKFSDILMKACSGEQQRAVRLSRVLSRPSTRRPDQVFLFPSSPDSDIRWATPAEEARILTTPPTQQGQLLPSQSSIRPTHEQGWTTTSSQSLPAQMTLTSPILDLVVKGTSLVAQKDEYLGGSSSCAARLQDLFRSSNDATMYGSCRLTLAGPSDNNMNRLYVEAGGSILRTLCGSLELHEWSSTNNIGGGNDNKSLGNLVADMIQGLLKEQVDLDWIFVEERPATDNTLVCDSVLRVQAVKLPRL